MKLGAISGGIFSLAKTGLVSGQTLSVHWCYQTAFEGEFPFYQASDQITEMSSICLTAAEAAGAFELALLLIEERLGAIVSTEVACWFQHPMMRKAGVRQAIPASNKNLTQINCPKIVSAAIHLMSNHLTEPLAVEQIARLVGVSARHLERQFKSATGKNPSG